MLRDLPRRLHVREKHTHRVIGNNFVGRRLLVKAKALHILGDQVKPDLASLFASLLQDKCLKRLVLLRRLLLQNMRQLMPENDARRRVAAGQRLAADLSHFGVLVDVNAAVAVGIAAPHTAVCYAALAAVGDGQPEVFCSPG